MCTRSTVVSVLVLLLGACGCGGQTEAASGKGAEAGWDAGLDGPATGDSKIDCGKPFADCDNDPANGCETSLAVDVENCGSCGHACSTLPHAVPVCSNGKCKAGTCESEYDGGEPLFADCDNNLANGCETSLADDVGNCGSCGHACSLPHAVPVCSNGTCTMGTCESGFADCTGIDGCETNLTTSPVNCGWCGNVCPDVPGTDPACAGGACVIGPCKPGFADCNKNDLDGCEADLLHDNAHCGACDIACPPPQVCQSAACPPPLP